MTREYRPNFFVRSLYLPPQHGETAAAHHEKIRMHFLRSLAYRVLGVSFYDQRLSLNLDIYACFSTHIVNHSPGVRHGDKSMITGKSLTSLSLQSCTALDTTSAEFCS